MDIPFQFSATSADSKTNFRVDSILRGKMNQKILPDSIVRILHDN